MPGPDTFARLIDLRARYVGFCFPQTARRFAHGRPEAVVVSTAPNTTGSTRPQPWLPGPKPERKQHS